MKHLLLFLHKWLSLPSALILFVVCLSGSLFVYTDNLLSLLHRPYERVEAMDGVPVSIETIQAELAKANPEFRVVNVTVHKDRTKAYKYLLRSKDGGLKSVFVHPVTGVVTGESRAHHFFYLLAHLHSELLLGKVGNWVVKVATIVFVLLLVTGFFLWKPKQLTRHNARHFFTLHASKTTRKRAFNHHRILGFYGLGLLLLLSLTGLVMAFEPLSHQVARAYGADYCHLEVRRTHAPANVTQVSGTGGDAPTSLDTLVAGSRNAFSVDRLVQEQLEKDGIDMVKVALSRRFAEAPLTMVAAHRIGILTHNGVPQLYDWQTGSPLTDGNALAEAKAHNLIMRIHIGNWAGGLGKFLTFLAGLIGSYLIITGLVIWWNRR